MVANLRAHLVYWIKVVQNSAKTEKKRIKIVQNTNMFYHKSVLLGIQLVDCNYRVELKTSGSHVLFKVILYI